MKECQCIIKSNAFNNNNNNNTFNKDELICFQNKIFSLAIDKNNDTCA